MNPDDARIARATFRRFEKTPSARKRSNRRARGLAA